MEVFAELQRRLRPPTQRATVERWALALRALATSAPKSREALGTLMPKAACFVEAATAEGKSFARARRAKAHRSTATVLSDGTTLQVVSPGTQN